MAGQQADGNGGWAQQKVPLWIMLLALGMGGTGAASGLGNWLWLDNNEPRFLQNVAKIDTLGERVEQIDRHLAHTDAQLEKLRDNTVSKDVGMERLTRGLEAINALRAEVAGLHKEIDTLRDRSREQNGR